MSARRTAPLLSILNPVPFRVFQRNGSNQATITVSGKYIGSPTAIEVRHAGGAWTTLDAAPAGGSFTGTTTISGDGALDVRFSNSTGITATVDWVGAGDIFLLIGQSNCSGRGVNNQRFTQTSGRASIFDNAYNWQAMLDPTDSNARQNDSVSSDFDPLGMGSLWPIVATLSSAARSVPLAFIPCAKGSTSLANWQKGGSSTDRTTLYGQAVYRALRSANLTSVPQSGIITAAIWIQGECASGTAAAYATSLQAMADNLFTDLAIKTIPTKLHICSACPSNTVATDGITIELARVGTNCLAGADLSDLTDDGDGYHFTTDAKLATVAARIYARLAALFP